MRCLVYPPTAVTVGHEVERGAGAGRAGAANSGLRDRHVVTAAHDLSQQALERGVIQRAPVIGDAAERIARDVGNGVRCRGSRRCETVQSLLERCGELHFGCPVGGGGRAAIQEDEGEPDRGLAHVVVVRAM